MNNRIVVENCGWHPCSGGIRVMNYLAALIHSIGHPVAVTSPCFYNPLIPVVGTCEPDDIVVYPEIVSGNPKGGSKVVRYLLYFPIFRYTDPRDCPVVYMPAFMESCRAAFDGPIGDDDIVELPNINYGEWLFPEPKTIEAILFTGKRNCKELPDIPGIVDIRGEGDLWFQRQRTISLLRRASRLYTMDHYTVLEGEADLCGCQVFRVHGPKDFRRIYPNAQQRIMRPGQDGMYARKFLDIVERFFRAEMDGGK